MHDYCLPYRQPSPAIPHLRAVDIARDIAFLVFPMGQLATE